MAERKILAYPDAFLASPTQPVDNIDGALQIVIDDMAETMYAAPGVGLAAIQVGVGKSLIVYDVAARDGERMLRVLINPRIVESQGEIVSPEEGCLSVPDYRCDVKRAERVLVEGFDRDGNPLRFDAEGFHAIVLQHEIDHLNGVLFIDRISSLKRGIYKKRIKKLLKQNE